MCCQNLRCYLRCCFGWLLGFGTSLLLRLRNLRFCWWIVPHRLRRGLRVFWDMLDKLIRVVTRVGIELRISKAKLFQLCAQSSINALSKSSAGANFATSAGSLSARPLALSACAFRSRRDRSKSLYKEQYLISTNLPISAKDGRSQGHSKP